MMLGSLLSYSQYPTTKIVGKDTVVIMTLKQGEDINKQFTVLKDSLGKASKELLKAKANIDVVLLKNRVLADSLENALGVAQANEFRMQCLENELELTSKELLGDRRFIRRQTLTVGGLLIGFTIFMSLLIK